MRRQETTETDTIAQWALTSQQKAAVDWLAIGRTVTDTAAAVEVSRQTVSEWQHHHPGFQAALNNRRQQLWESMVDRLRSLLPKALAVVERELDGEHPLPAAVHVLKACGLYGVPAPFGPTEAADAEIAQKQKEQERVRQSLLATCW
jgi:hypothetical protein